MLADNDAVQYSATLQFAKGGREIAAKMRDSITTIPVFAAINIGLSISWKSSSSDNLPGRPQFRSIRIVARLCFGQNRPARIGNLLFRNHLVRLPARAARCLFYGSALRILDITQQVQTWHFN
jgi:hypothetical protein